MGGAMARALCDHPSAYRVTVVEQDAARQRDLAAMGIEVHATLVQAPVADVLLLAIKPQQFTASAPALEAYLQRATPLMVSMMAGVTLAQLQCFTPLVVRAMPNLAAMIAQSMTVLCAPALEKNLREKAHAVAATFGEVAWVEEEATLHAVTAISGSGPAYLFAFMEALEAAALAQGLNAALAKKLVQQTVKGAALLAGAAQAADPETLRSQVTSKGGTTEAALQHLLATPAFFSLLVTAVQAARARSESLAQDA